MHATHPNQTKYDFCVVITAQQKEAVSVHNNNTGNSVIITFSFSTIIHRILETSKSL